MRTELANSRFRQDFVNADGGMDAQQYEQAAKQTEGAIKTWLANRAAQTAETGCKKPIFNIGKKKQAYEKCLAENKAKRDAASYPTYTPSPSPVREKGFFETPAGITVAVVGTAALITGVIVLVKVLKK